MATSNGGFFPNFKLPFGMSNANQVATPADAKPQHQTGAQQLAQPANDNQQPNPPGDNGQPNNDPNNNADPNKGQAGSQLDNFKGIFTMPTGPDGKPLETADPHNEPLLNLDPAKLQEAAAKMNFAAGVAPELLQKAMGGDAQAMSEVMSAAGRNAFVAATASMTRVVEDAINRNNQRNDQTLASRVRDVQINQAPVKHPALAHPAAAPVLAALKQQIAATNPTLSPDKVAEHAENYVIAMSTDVNTHNQQQTQAKTKSLEPDYGVFLGQ